MHRHRGAAIVFLAFLGAATVTMSAPRTASAQDHAEFKAAYVKGLELFEAGKWAESRESFLRAYTIRPEPLILFNVGQTYRKEGNLKNAVVYYRRYLKTPPPDPIPREEAETRADAERHVREIGKKLAEPTETEPTETEPTEAEPTEAEPTETEPTETEPTETDLGVSDVEPERGLRRTTWISIALGGAGLAALGTGVYFALDARSAESDVERAVANGDAWTPELEDKHDSGKRSAKIARWTMALGSVAMVGGAVLYLVGRAGGDASDQRLTFTPAVGPRTVGASARFRF